MKSHVGAAAAAAAPAALAALALATMSNAAEHVERRPFVPTNLKAPFIEQFTPGWENRWSSSSATKEQSGGEVFSYSGKWSVEEPTVFPGLLGDEGLVAKSKAAQHAISAQFPQVIDPKGKPLVVQYETKLQKGLSCGGAYLKLLTESPEGIQAKEFSDKTPYTIMFGPDKCGATNKVHFIFRHKNPKTGELEEKHLKYPPYAKLAKVTSLYTLHVHPNNTYEIFINHDSKKTGSLLEDFDPPVNPPKEIDDPKDKKPSDWVDEARIVDAKATKPEDWDEEAPLEIPDESTEKPEGWLDDEPLTVPDPEAVKPEEWDEEEDGEWVAPLVPNPKCDEAPGCGPWTRPMIRNPAYKGKWMAPMIDNPAYKGPWAPRKIANPDYYEDENPNHFSRIAGIGFELWTMDEDILFDNIYVGHSIEDARQLAREQFDEKLVIEQNGEKAEEKKAEAESDKSTDDLAGMVNRLRGQVEDFAEAVRRDPIEAIKAQPQVAGLIATVFAGLFGLVGVIGAAFGGSSSAKAAPSAKPAKKVDAPKAKTTAVAAKDGEVKRRSKATTAQDADDDE